MKVLIETITSRRGYKFFKFNMLNLENFYNIKAELSNSALVLLQSVFFYSQFFSSSSLGTLPI